jgi:hypothetical protein
MRILHGNKNARIRKYSKVCNGSGTVYVFIAYLISTVTETFLGAAWCCQRAPSSSAEVANRLEQYHRLPVPAQVTFAIEFS